MRRNGEQWIHGDGVPFGAWKCSGTRKRWVLHNIVNALNATESFTLNDYNGEFYIVCFIIIMVILIL